jgi:hypothetical protein
MAHAIIFRNVSALSLYIFPCLSLLFIPLFSFFLCFSFLLFSASFLLKEKKVLCHPYPSPHSLLSLSPGNAKGYLCTIDLLFDWLGISCMTTDKFCFYLQNRLIQTSQTVGQWYSNTSPFSIPCSLLSPTLWHVSHFMQGILKGISLYH